MYGEAHMHFGVFALPDLVALMDVGRVTSGARPILPNPVGRARFSSL
jgi:hypothetical protein